MPSYITPFVSRLKITDKQLRTITLGRVLNPPQRRLIAAVEQDITDGRPVRYITLKARQVGISTITEAMAFQWAFCLNRSRGLIVSHTGESTKHLIDMTHHYWQTWWARELYRTTSNARDRLAWEPTHSSISLLPAKSQEGARSRTLHFVHASEAAFWDHPKELMYALQAGVPRTALSAIFVESTANGIGNWFHETWEASKRGDVEFRPMFFPWWAHPEYTAHHVGRGEDARKLLLARPVAGGTLDDEEWHLYRGLTQRGIPDVEIRSRLIWRRLTIATEMSGDLDKFHQEYPACLVAGTRVGTDSGIVPIEQVGRGVVTRRGRVVGTQIQPSSRVYRLETEEGYRLTGTVDHPIITRDGPVELGALTAGQSVVLQPPTTATSVAVVEWHEHAIDCSIRVTDDLALFLGIFAGDGSHHGGTTSIVCDAKDQDTIDECLRLFRVLFGVDASVRVVGEKGGGREIRTGVVAIRRTLDRLGVIGRRPSVHGTNRGYHRKVCVPETIWRSPDSAIRAFLRGLFEADGFAGAEGEAPRVSLFSQYEEFLRDVQILLLSQGVVSRLTGNALEMRGERAEMFRDKIGWVGARKTNRAAGWTADTGRGRRRATNEMVAYVSAVVDTGDDAPTYNLTLANGTDHLFDANGVLTHNTDDEAFLSTGRNVFQLEYLRAVYDPIIPDRGRLVYDSTAANNVRFVPDPDGPLHVYYHPEPAGRYMVGIDNSKATRFGDWAVAQVLDRRTMEQMAVWRARGHKDAMFAEQMILLGYYYNEGMLAPEYNFNGATISGFLQAKYRHLYTHSKAGKMRGLHEDVVGWPMTDQTKAECMDNLTREVFAGFQGRSDFVIHDEQTYYEMKNYIVSDKGKYENSKEAEHDDTVTALAIGVSATVYERPSLMTHEMANPAEALYGTRSPVDEAFRRGVAAVAEGAGMDGVEVAPTTVEREDGTRGIRLPPPVSPYSSRKERGMYEDGEGWGW